MAPAPAAPVVGAPSAGGKRRAMAESPSTPVRQGSRREAPTKAEGSPTPIPTKKPHERAANTGLVTDNPFE